MCDFLRGKSHAVREFQQDLQEIRDPGEHPLKIRGHDTSVSEIDVDLHRKCASCGRGSHVGLAGEQAISSL